MSMPLGYKDNRERLNELLELMEVPRILYHQLQKLNSFIAYSRTENPKAPEALRLIYSIAPMPIVRFPLCNQQQEQKF